MKNMIYVAARWTVHCASEPVQDPLTRAFIRFLDLCYKTTRVGWPIHSPPASLLRPVLPGETPTLSGVN